jgi:hypothetical protein
MTLTNGPVAGRLPNMEELSTTGPLRAKLAILAATLGNSPAGHAVAYDKWLDMAYEAHDYGGGWRPFRTVKNSHGRKGFLALAEDALEREDLSDFQDVCIGAAIWEARRLGQ